MENNSSEASKAVFKSLNILFLLIKISMVLLVILLFKSGYRTVSENEQAISFSFNEIIGVHNSGESYFIWPKPVGKTLYFPSASTPLTVSTKHFWYKNSPNKSAKQDNNNSSLTLGDEGYVVTSDSFLIHFKCQATYYITDVKRYYTTIYKQTTEENKKDNHAKAVISSLLEDVIIEYVAQNKMYSSFFTDKKKFIDSLTSKVIERVQKADIGVEIVRLDLKSEDYQAPYKVKDIFNNINKAYLTSQKQIADARITLQKNITQAKKNAQDIITRAQINADNLNLSMTEFKSLLNSFEKDGKDALYAYGQRKIKEFLQNIKTKYILNDSTEQEIRLLLNRQLNNTEPKL